MDSVINLETLDTHTIPDTLTFDVSNCARVINQLVTLRNAGSESPVEVRAAVEILLKELAVTQQGVLVNEIDVYGVSPSDIRDTLEREISNVLLGIFPWLVFTDLSLIELNGVTATYALVTVEIDESMYKYI